jgi:hypothetical protein
MPSFAASSYLLIVNFWGGSIPGALPNIAAVAQVMAELVSSLTQEVATYPWTAALAKALDPVALSESREVGWFS